MYNRHIPDSRFIIETRSSGSSGGLATSTIIFIVVGVVCLLVLLIGFYLVSRSRGPSNLASSAPSTHPPNAADTHPQCARDRRHRSGGWKIWKTWLRSSHPTTSEPSTCQVSPAPATTSPILPARSDSRDHHHHPPVVSRPRQTRRVTSPSIQTDFSHSHITQEALQNYHACAYDLDGDLVIEMLHSARDDVGPGYPEWGSDHASLQEAVVPEPRGIATSNIEGGVGGSTALTPAAQSERGDYEGWDAILEEVIVRPLTTEPVAALEGERVEVEDAERERLRPPVGVVEGLS